MHTKTEARAAKTVRIGQTFFSLEYQCPVRVFATHYLANGRRKLHFRVVGERPGEGHWGHCEVDPDEELYVYVA